MALVSFTLEGGLCCIGISEVILTFLEYRMGLLTSYLDQQLGQQVPLPPYQLLHMWEHFVKTQAFPNGPETKLGVSILS